MTVFSLRLLHPKTFTLSGEVFLCVSFAAENSSTVLSVDSYCGVDATVPYHSGEKS